MKQNWSPARLSPVAIGVGKPTRKRPCDCDEFGEQGVDLKAKMGVTSASWSGVTSGNARSITMRALEFW